MNSESDNSYTRVVNSTIVIVFHLFLIYVASYAICGWLTVGDIKAKSEAAGYDTEEVLYTLIGKEPDIEVSGEKGSARFSFPPGDFYFKRLQIQFHKIDIVSNDKQGSFLMNYQNSFPLDPFLINSNSVVNTWFVIGLGYLISIFVVIIRCIRKEKMALSYILIRPLAGALASACLYFITIAGGAVIWKEVGSIDIHSLGVIGLIGAIYAERMDGILKKSISDVQINN